MKLNPIDRAVIALAPAHGVARVKARLQAEALRAMPDFTAISVVPGMQASFDDRNSPPAPDAAGDGFVKRLRRWANMPRDARSDTIPYLRGDRAASRELARSSPIAVGAIDTNINRVVGTGLALSAQPNRKILGWTAEQALEWKLKTQAEFSMWADSAESDIEQELNFYQQQALVLRATLESGDTFTLLPDGEPTSTQPYKLRVQVIEADRVGNPGNKADEANMSGGVRTNAAGAPTAFHVYTTHPGGFLPGHRGSMFDGIWVERMGRSGRRRMLHHYRKLRPGQPRGLPYLAPIIDCIKQISRYTEAEIMAAVITAYFTVFIETQSGSAAPVFQGDPNDPAAGGPGKEIGLAPGAVVGLMPGEKPTIANPMRPNPNFEPFINAVIKQMGMALGIPYELLVKQFNASYSASKAALLDAWVYFRSVRTWLSISFCQPVYETWLAEAVANGRISAPGFFADPLLRWAYTRAAWPGDSMGSINPKDEVKAYVDAIDARIMTRERAEWELWGTDFNETIDTKISEQTRLKAADMLPTPKAGAAAPARATQTEPEESTT